jgi:hypothetical protein
MLRAALSCPTVRFENPQEEKFVRRCVKLGDNYSSVRNIIAHDMPLYLKGLDHEFKDQYVYMDGKYDRFLGGENAMPVAQLACFHQNLSHLYILMAKVLFCKCDAGTIELYTKYLEKLPADPRLKMLGAADAKFVGNLGEDGLEIRYS